MTPIQEIQAILGVTSDGIWGSESQSALDALVNDAGWHSVIASSFGDTADKRRFDRCKANGGSDQSCFKVGDNCIGLWGDPTEEGTGPSCALPPEDWVEFYNTARGKKVIVKSNNNQVTCELKDTMPHRANIRNGAGIDLNPDAVAMLGMKTPIMAKAAWSWA